MIKPYVFKDRSFQRFVGKETRTGTIELTVDWERLVRTLGMKAAFNKSRKSGLKIGLKAKFIQKETTNV